METGEGMARWARGEQTFCFSSTGTGLMSFEAEDLAALTEALVGRATLTDDGFLYASFRQVEAPDTWTADAAYLADSPIPYTLTAKAATLLGRPVPRRSPCEQCTLVVFGHVLHKPDLALRPARYLRHQDLCAAV